MVTLGLYSQYWLLINVSGFGSPFSALFCMLVCRGMFSVPYIHVNIFQVRAECLWKASVSVKIQQNTSILQINVNVTHRIGLPLP